MGHGVFLFTFHGRAYQCASTAAAFRQIIYYLRRDVCAAVRSHPLSDAERPQIPPGENAMHR